MFTILLIILATSILWYNPHIPEAIKNRKQIYYLNASKIADLGYPINYYQNEYVSSEEASYRFYFLMLLLSVLGVPLLVGLPEQASGAAGTPHPAHCRVVSNKIGSNFKYLKTFRD